MRLLELAFQMHGRLSELLAREAREYRLTPTEVVALFGLAQGAASISGVAQATGIRPNGASVLVDRLCKRGLVRRERDRRDNRIVSVALTDDGRALATALAERVGDQLRFILSPLSSAEQEHVNSLLARLIEPDVRTQSP